MNEYTPTTEVVRDAYSEGYGYHEDQFDRWLAQVRQEAAAQGYESGYEHGLEHGREEALGLDA